MNHILRYQLLINSFDYLFLDNVIWTINKYDSEYLKRIKLLSHCDLRSDQNALRRIVN